MLHLRYTSNFPTCLLTRLLMCLQLVAKLTLPSNQNQNLLHQVIKKRYFIGVFENFTTNLQNRRGHCHMDIYI